MTREELFFKGINAEFRLTLETIENKADNFHTQHFLTLKKSACTSVLSAMFSFQEASLAHSSTFHHDACPLLGSSTGSQCCGLPVSVPVLCVQIRIVCVPPCIILSSANTEWQEITLVTCVTQFSKCSYLYISPGWSFYNKISTTYCRAFWRNFFTLWSILAHLWTVSPTWVTLLKATDSRMHLASRRRMRRHGWSCLLRSILRHLRVSLCACHKT